MRPLKRILFLQYKTKTFLALYMATYIRNWVSVVVRKIFDVDTYKYDSLHMEPKKENKIMNATMVVWKIYVTNTHLYLNPLTCI